MEVPAPPIIYLLSLKWWNLYALDTAQPSNFKKTFMVDTTAKDDHGNVTEWHISEPKTESQGDDDQLQQRQYVALDPTQWSQFCKWYRGMPVESTTFTEFTNTGVAMVYQPQCENAGLGQSSLRIAEVDEYARKLPDDPIFGFQRPLQVMLHDDARFSCNFSSHRAVVFTQGVWPDSLCQVPVRHILADG